MKTNKILTFISSMFYLLVLFIFSCKSTDTDPEAINQPNIIWIVAEDLSPYLPSFGDSTITTPNISKLAREGICYDNFYSPSGVCAPSRSAIATGMYPVHLGSNHMRTGPWYTNNLPQHIIDGYVKYMPPGLKAYEAIPPAGTKMMSEFLRAEGYYCTNNAKEDYQFRKTDMAWDESSREAHWRGRDENQPFFSIFNLGITHESQIWARAKDSLWVDENLEVSVPPYLPSTDTAIMDIRRMYSNIKIMDSQVGKLLDELTEDDLLDNTIVIWYTDHGGPLPRQKRLLYDSGLKVPMVVRFPDQRNAGTRDDQLISFIDLAPTVLSLCGISPKQQFDGKAFLGPNKRKTEAEYIYAAADRFDETFDMNRAVRDKRYKYIRYYQPEKPMFLHVNYRDQMPIMRELYKLRDAGQLNEQQALWFRETKPTEELFDTWEDPHEVNNLADDDEYASILADMRTVNDAFPSEFEDLGRIPEVDLLNRFYPDGEQPITIEPSVVVADGQIEISTETEGATIGFQMGSDSASWSIYTGPIEKGQVTKIRTKAHRLGYLPSNENEMTFN